MIPSLITSPYREIKRKILQTKAVCYNVSEIMFHILIHFFARRVDMVHQAANMTTDRTPHAYPGNSEADQAGSCLFMNDFPKQSCSNEALLNGLEAKGLRFGSYSREEALQVLETNGYYRLKGYSLTLRCNGEFKAATCLDDIMAIASLDAKLSSLLLDLIRPVEICLRSSVAQELALEYGPLALTSSAPFQNPAYYSQMQNSLAREQRQAQYGKVPFVTHNLKRYGQLPIWASVELASLGTLSKMFRNLVDSTVMQRIAQPFNMKARYLENWLRYITQIRNMCAHHDRLYNRMFPIRPALFKEHRDIDTMRLFPAFIVLFRLNDAINPQRQAEYRFRLARIVEEHRNVDLRPMGFPSNWREVLAIPSGQSNNPRPRGKKGGRPAKNQAALEEAFYLYDMRKGSVRQICEQTGIGVATFYKYLHQRPQMPIQYEVVPLE